MAKSPDTSSKALKKAIDDARDHINGGRDRHALALLVGIVRRLALADDPEVEQPIAPEPPEVIEPIVPPAPGTVPPPAPPPAGSSKAS